MNWIIWILDGNGKISITNYFHARNNRPEYTLPHLSGHKKELSRGKRNNQQAETWHLCAYFHHLDQDNLLSSSGLGILRGSVHIRYADISFVLIVQSDLILIDREGAFRWRDFCQLSLRESSYDYFEAVG
jgi:hypothetical protein